MAIELDEVLQTVELWIGFLILGVFLLIGILVNLLLRVRRLEQYILEGMDGAEDFTTFGTEGEQEYGQGQTFTGRIKKKIPPNERH